MLLANPLDSIEISVPARQTFLLQSIQMKIQNLNPQKYKRFFAFGCSFTNYWWPTWADIIGQDVPVYENWGRGGAGNHFIFNSVIEANLRHSFTKDDLVMIMWSSITREDRYSNNNWIPAPPNLQESVYGKDWVKKFSTDTRGFMIRDCAMIKATQTLLKTLDCDWAQLVMQPITNFDMPAIFAKYGSDVELPPESEGRVYWKDTFNELCRTGIVHPMFENKDVLELYKDIFTQLEPSYEVQDASFRDDIHPCPAGALEMLCKIWPDNTLSTKSKEYADFWQTQVQEAKEITSPIHKLPNAVKRL